MPRSRFVPHLLLALCATAPFGAAQASQPELVVSSENGKSILQRGDGVVLHATTNPIQNARFIDVPGSQTVLLLWEEVQEDDRTSSHYRIAKDGQDFSRERETSYMVRMVRGSFNPLRNVPDFSDSVLAGSGQVFIVQFVTQPLEVFRDTIEEMGGTVYHFISDHAHLVRMNEATRAQVESLPFVRWVGDYHPEYRLEPEVLLGLRSGQLDASQRYNIQVFERGPSQKRIVAERIQALQGQVDAAIPDGFLLEATLSPEQVAEVATWDEVLWLDRWSEREVDMNLVRIDGGADYVETQTGYTGDGVRGEVMDGNVLSTHTDFQSDPILFHGSHSGDAGHGTPTTGIVFGDGAGSANARGMLPDGQPIFADYGFLGNRYAHTAQLLQSPYFAVFQSNSWGNNLTTQYNTISSQMDDILFINDIVICQSQSNAGSQLSRPQAWAKNIVACGGILHRNTLNTADDDWAGQASIGPASDGRIKPDLNYWYDSIRTTSSNGGYTNSFGGTSAATPEVAGHFGIFYQMWSENVFNTNPSGSTVFERRPKASTARAMMINTASQYPFNGTNHDRTRTHQGWGRPNLQTLYDDRDRFFIVNEEHVLQNLESIIYPLIVPAGEPVLMVTLAYLEPAGTTSGSQHRINDLSVRVTAPNGGTSYWGNNGLHGGVWSTSGGSSNTLDPIENVFIENPAQGTWLVEVIADEINEDNHVETGAVDADFALVVRGTDGLDGNPCLAPTAYCTSAPNSFSGTGALFETTGTTSVSANDLTLLTTLLPPNKAGIYYYGAGSQEIPFGNGFRCVSGQVFRLPLVFSNVFGESTFALDLNDLPAGGDISSGETWYFQYWYRDPMGGGAGFNLSGGIEAEFCE